MAFVITSRRTYRIGQIVPSSNTTMETEIPRMLLASSAREFADFTFHSSRMRMRHVSREELSVMNGQTSRCAQELADARMDVIATACLVAIMCQGVGYHRTAEEELQRAVQADSPDTATLSSAGALIAALHALGAKQVSIITPYTEQLTKLVANYIEAEGVEVRTAVSLNVPDNIAVGRLDPLQLLDIAEKLPRGNLDAVVLSACVQMPSLPAIDIVQNRLGIPVISTATSTVFQMLKMLGLPTLVPKAGEILSGHYA
jgi:maleate isomerase